MTFLIFFLLLLVSLFELRIDESEEDTPQSPTSKSLKSRLSMGNRKNKADRYSISTSEPSKSSSHTRSQSSYSQQTKSSMAKMNRQTLYETSFSKKDKSLSIYSRNGQDVSKTLKDPKKKKYKKNLLSNNLVPCLSVPNLTCIDNDEALSPSNLQFLSDLSLSHSVPEVNTVDDQGSQSSRTSSDAQSTAAKNINDGFSSEAKESASLSAASKRRITIGCAPDDTKKGIKSSSDADLMPPPLSTTLNSRRQDTSKRPINRNRRPQPELTLDQAKNILLGKSGVLGKVTVKVSEHNKTSTAAEDSLSKESDSQESTRSSNLTKYKPDSTERCSSTSSLNLGPDRPHSPAISSRAIALGLRNQEIKPKSFLGDLAPSPNDPPERDNPSKLISTSPPFHTNMGPNSLGSKYHTLPSVSSLAVHKDSELKWTNSLSSRKSSGSVSLTNTSEPSSESNKLLPSVKSKVAMFNASSSATRRQSLEKYSSPMLRSVEGSSTSHGSDSDTEKEIKRPDKSRSHSPASLITSSHIISR